MPVISASRNAQICYWLLSMKPRSSLENPAPLNAPVQWHMLEGLQDYAITLQRMEETAAQIVRAEAQEQVWLLEHPPLYTAGTSAKPQDLIAPKRFPVFETGRGGQYTYHGPGQRVGYVMLDLKARGGDVRAFVAGLERWLIGTLASFNVKGEVREDRVGVWVETSQGEAKIAALGIRVRQGVTFHGVSLNVDPDLEHFSGIIPCGVADHGVTSLAALGVNASMYEVDAALQRAFTAVFQ